MSIGGKGGEGGLGKNSNINKREGETFIWHSRVTYIYIFFFFRKYIKNNFEK